MSPLDDCLLFVIRQLESVKYILMHGGGGSLSTTNTNFGRKPLMGSMLINNSHYAVSDYYYLIFESCIFLLISAFICIYLRQQPQNWLCETEE